MREEKFQGLQALVLTLSERIEKIEKRIEEIVKELAGVKE